MTITRNCLIGVVHLLPLPGSHRYAGDMDTIVRRAVSDAVTYAKAGFDAVTIENFGDTPFTKGRVPAETVAAMTRAAVAVMEASKLPIGLNVLRNDPLSGLAIAAAVGASFIRVNVHTGAMLTDQGIIEGNAYETIRTRERLFGPQIRNPKSKEQTLPSIFADVLVKHAAPLAPQPIEILAWDCIQRGFADGLIITGEATGSPVDMNDLRRVREALPEAKLFVGSGASEKNAADLLKLANALIVGTSLKQGGITTNPVDLARAKRLRQIARQ